MTTTNLLYLKEQLTNEKIEHEKKIENIDIIIDLIDDDGGIIYKDIEKYTDGLLKLQENINKENKEIDDKINKQLEKIIKRYVNQVLDCLNYVEKKYNIDLNDYDSLRSDLFYNYITFLTTDLSKIIDNNKLYVLAEDITINTVYKITGYQLYPRDF